MSAIHPTESDEWHDELVGTWTEMYKKSMVTLAILQAVATAGWASVDDVAGAFSQSTGWMITERGL